MSINHLKFIILAMFVFLTINKSFCQKNGLGINYITWSNVSIEYERYFLSHSRISVGYRYDYRDYSPLNGGFGFTHYDYDKKGYRALFEYRYYFLKDAHKNSGVYIGYGFITGKNRLRYKRGGWKGNLEVDSNSNIFKVGFQYNESIFNFDCGISFSKNSTKDGIDSFLISTGNYNEERIALRSDLTSSHFEVDIGLSYMF